MVTPLTASNIVYTKYIWWLPACNRKCLLASVGRPTIKVEGQPPRIWEVSSDWSSYRNGMYRSIEQAVSGEGDCPTLRTPAKEANMNHVLFNIHHHKLSHLRWTLRPGADTNTAIKWLNGSGRIEKASVLTLHKTKIYREKKLHYFVRTTDAVCFSRVKLLTTLAF